MRRLLPPLYELDCNVGEGWLQFTKAREWEKFYQFRGFVGMQDVTVRFYLRVRLCAASVQRKVPPASGLAHREFEPNSAGLSGTRSVRSNSRGIAHAALRQVPDRTPDNPALFANSPSRASRLAEPFAARRRRRAGRADRAARLYPVISCRKERGADSNVRLFFHMFFSHRFFHIGLNFRGGIYIIFLYSRRFPYDGEAVK